MFKHYVKSLKKEIKQNSYYKDFVDLGLQINKSEYLSNLKKRINVLKQEMCKTIYNKDVHNKLLKEYNDLVNEYTHNPLIENYNYLKSIIIDELEQIKGYILI